MKTIAVHVSHH